MSKTPRPKAPDGYRVMLGKNVPKIIPNGMMYWQDNEWKESMYCKGEIMYGQHPSEFPISDAICWHAIPDTRKKHSVILRSEPQPDADGWIPHVPGDKCPCDGELKVQAKLRDGFTTENRLACSLSWTDAKCDADIIAWRPAKPAAQPEPTIKESLTVHDSNPTPPRYDKTVGGVKLDPYRILVAYGITHPAHQHAIKKLLRAGNDPHQSLVEDIDEVIGALTRYKEMIAEDSTQTK